MSLAAAIHRICRVEVEQRGGGRLTLASVEIGELAGVEPRLLVFAWNAVVAGGPDAGARLEVRWIASSQRCPDCGPVPDRQPGSWLRPCPWCGGPLLVEGGGELEVRSIDFEPATMPAVTEETRRRDPACEEALT